MPGFRDHATTPRAPLSGTGLRDLSHALVDGRPISPPYSYLAQLVQYGEHHAADPAGIAIARTRLAAAAERGNKTAATLLAEIAAATS